KAEGSDHEPVFTVEVTVDGLGAASASARSHKEAEALAAAKLLSMV
ncbi:MAG: ribonuclease III, partial [Kiritimatiellae bacterium]|nr:ribonuclease III [Kiritimatiellia bacterium]